MKLSEMSMAQLDACLLKYIKYVAAIEREKNRRLMMAAKEDEKKGTEVSRLTNTRQKTSSKITSSGLVVSDEDLKAAEATPITQEDVECVTRILKMSAQDLALSMKPSTVSAVEEGLTLESVEKEIQRTALKLSTKKIFLKALELDKVNQNLSEEVLKSYVDLMDLLRKGEDKTNPRFPRDAGVTLSTGLEQVLSEIGK